LLKENKGGKKKSLTGGGGVAFLGGEKGTRRKHRERGNIFKKKGTQSKAGKKGGDNALRHRGKSGQTAGTAVFRGTERVPHTDIRGGSKKKKKAIVKTLTGKINALSLGYKEDTTIRGRQKKKY